MGNILQASAGAYALSPGGAGLISEMRLASFRGGVLNWSGQDNILVGERIQLCAWLTRGNRLVAESPGPPDCPSVFVADPLPAPYLAMSRLDRRMDGPALRRLARGLPVNPSQDQESAVVIRH